MSGLSPLPQVGAKAVLDATAAYRMGNQLLAFQEQYFKAFPQTTRQATGGKRPALGLNQVDPIVAWQLQRLWTGRSPCCTWFAKPFMAHQPHPDPNYAPHAAAHLLAVA